MDSTSLPPVPSGPGILLQRTFERTISEAVGAAHLFAQLRPFLSFDGHTKALAELSELEAVAMAAKAALAMSGPCALLATAEQRQTIFRLLTHPKITLAEKAALLLELPRRNMESASVLILSLKLDINERAGYAVFPEVATYGVVAEVFMVGDSLTRTSAVASTAQAA